MSHQWKRSAIALFKSLVQGVPEHLVKRMLEHEPASDLELVLEYAMCAGSVHLALFVAEIMQRRQLEVHIQVLVRISLWQLTPAMRTLFANLGTRIKIAVPSAHKFVEALFTTCAVPAAFDRLLAVCPEVSLTSTAVDAIAAVAWDPTMVKALGDCWIDDAYPGAWLRAPSARVALRVSDAAEKAVQTARARYHQAHSDAPTFDLVTLYSDEEVPDVFIEPVASHSACLYAMLNKFVYDADAKATFEPVKSCSDSSHAICRMLKEK